MSATPAHAYGGARSMVLLHEAELRRFLGVWSHARDTEVPLPKADDPDYASYDKLLAHVLACAPAYMAWCCAKLELAAPDIPPVPGDLAEHAQEFLEQVCAGWRAPLAEVPRKRFSEVYPSSWGVDYCVDAMLEHAVMHPLRHSAQLERLVPGAAQNPVPEHVYTGARSLLHLQSQELQRFVVTLRESRDAGVPLPATQNPAYASYDALHAHVLAWSRAYLVWVCQKLDLPEPAAPATPSIAACADEHLGELLAAWRTPLTAVPEARFNEAFPSSWGVTYCIDSMLEHAVMHPIRHRAQLERL